MILSNESAVEHALDEASPNQMTSVGNHFQILQWIAIVALGYLLICAVGLIGTGFQTATGSEANEMFSFATNPFAGLVVGTVATALIQSSSTVTSIIVGLVAGGLPVSVAVPMIMGANVGTSITNTIVSLGHVREKKEFARAFAAATVHDFFNLLSVVIFLPLEMMFGVLERIGGVLASIFVVADASLGSVNFVSASTSPVVNGAKRSVESLSDGVAGMILIAIGIMVIFMTIHLAGKLLKRLMVGRAKDIMRAAIGKGPVAGIASGTLVTILVQSSSTTTSLMVPLAGSGAFGLKQIYRFTLGANIGTCVTALLAATGVESHQSAALQIAFIHLTYNLLGVLVIYGLPFLRYQPVRAAEWMSATASENKLIALAYIVGVFFLIPGLCLGISSNF